MTTVPRCRLAPLPTPLLRAPALGAALGVSNLWLKRDDLIAFAFGGNKVRGLEFMLADARERGADVVITGAGAQSNHVRATAAAAAWAGLDAVAVYWGFEPARAGGNLALTRLLGARTVFTASDDRASVDAAMESVAAELRAAGRRPYVIPRGGATALGAFAHILAVSEVAEQCRAAGIEPGVVYLAVGSGGTYAGWLAGIRMLGLAWRLEGFTVSRPVAEVKDRIVLLAREGAALAGSPERFAASDVVVHGGFIGAGYGVPTPEGAAAIALAARTEGVFLDPTYTGKAFAGVAAHAAAGRIRAGETVLFIHTGGAPALFAA
jgi:D-cysteine desulfhydrase family pyridoxal phosphate-dependent enzyme